MNPKTPRTLSILSASMGLGVVWLIGAVVFFHVRCRAVPSIEQISAVNRMTALAMVAALVAIIASEVVWKAQLARISVGDVDQAVTTAFIVRTALREAAAVLGLAVALVAALDGVLKIYPAYWVNLIPAGLFFAYLAMHWPSLESLRAEISGDAV